MNEQTEVDIHFLGKRYRVLCDDGQRSVLEKLIGQMEKRVNTIRGSQPMASSESALLMLCINMMYETSQQTTSAPPEQEQSKVIESICQKIDDTLANTSE